MKLFCHLEVCHGSHECHMVLPENLEAEPNPHPLYLLCIYFSQVLLSFFTSLGFEIVRMILAFLPGQGH